MDLLEALYGCVLLEDLQIFQRISWRRFELECSGCVEDIDGLGVAIPSMWENKRHGFAYICLQENRSSNHTPWLGLGVPGIS
jgi:hypothetical protein